MPLLSCHRSELFHRSLPCFCSRIGLCLSEALTPLSPANRPFPPPPLTIKPSAFSPTLHNTFVMTIATPHLSTVRGTWPLFVATKKATVPIFTVCWSLFCAASVFRPISPLGFLSPAFRPLSLYLPKAPSADTIVGFGP